MSDKQRRPLTQWFRETFKLSTPTIFTNQYPFDIMKGPPDPDWARSYPSTFPGVSDPNGNPDTDQGRPNTVYIHQERIGSSGTISFTGYPDEDYLHILKGKNKANVYDQMRRSDTQVKMCLNAVKNPIRAAEWDVNPVNPDDPDEIEIAEFVKYVLFENMDRPFAKFISEALTCIDFGHSVFEITNKIVADDPKWQTFVGIKDLGWRSPKTIERWNLDKQTDRLESILQLAWGDTSRFVTIPADFLLVFSVDREGSLYEGISMLRPCYGPWSRKDLYLKLNAIGIEKFAIPTPLVGFPQGQQNSDQHDRLAAALQDFTGHQSAYLMYPDNYKVQLVPNLYDPQKVETAIDNEDKRMVKAFLANFMELGMGGASGNRSLGETLKTFFLGGIEYIAKEVCDQINLTLIPLIVKQNYGERDSYPKLKVSGIDDNLDGEFGTMLKNLADGQYITPDDPLEEFLRKKLKWPEMSNKGQRAVISKGALGGAGPANPTDTLGSKLSERIAMAQARRIKNIQDLKS